MSVRRLGRHLLDPDALPVTEDSVDHVRRVIPLVLEQLATDKESARAAGGHQAMVRTAKATELYLAALQQWTSRAEDVLHFARSDGARNMGETTSTDQSDVYSQSATSSISRTHAEVLECVPARRGKFLLQSGSHLLMVDGLFMEQSSDVLLLDRVLRKSLSGYVIRAKVGERSGSSVECLSEEMIAVKVFERERGDQKRSGGSRYELVERELLHQRRLSTPGHPYVMELLRCFEDEDCIYATMPLGGKELFDVVALKGPLHEPQARQVFREMLSALQYVHDRGIAHRDVSPENFLMDAKTGSHPILIDFGLAYQMEAGEDAHWAPILQTGFVGKVIYAAPEVWGTEAYDGCAVDLWSAGVTLFVMLFGVPPWKRALCLDDHDSYTCIAKEQKLQEILCHWGFPASEAVIDMLQRIFTPDTQARPSVETLLAHPWFTQ